MKIRILLAALVSTIGLYAAVVRPAPDVRWIDAAGKAKSFAAFKGQPIVLLIAPTPTHRAFRGQLSRLRGHAERLGAVHTIFVVAFTETDGRVPSDIPFAIAADGPKVGYEYDVQGGFAIAVIGRDGNLDYITNKVLPGQRVLDVINNSFVAQSNMRRP